MKERRRRAVAAALVLVAVGASVLAATGFEAQAKGLPGGTITVGYGANLTGFLAVHDKLIANGAKLAVDQIDAKGGIGGKVKIKLIREDTKSDPAASVSVAMTNKCVNSDGKCASCPGRSHSSMA